MDYQPEGGDYQKGFANGDPALPQQLPQPSSVFFYDTTASLVTASTPLADGSAILLTVSGTFSYWDSASWRTVCHGTPEANPVHPSPARANGPVGSDPEYIFAHPEDNISCVNGTPRSTRPSISLSTDGGRNFTDPLPLNYSYNPAHVYQYRITGKGHPLQVRLGDSFYGDNYGILRFEALP
jgi:hypothetical protein